MRHRLQAWSVAIALAIFATGVQASPALTSTMASQATVDAALRKALTAPAPAQADASALDFRRSAAVTATERDRMASQAASQPNGAALEDVVRSGKLLSEFDGLLRRFGYSPQNLNDVLAAWLVLAWEIVNDGDAAAQADGAKAVRRQLAGPLSAVPALRDMDDAAKQTQAERTAYMAMVAVASHQALKRGGDPAKLEALRRDVRQDLLKSGVDLQRYTLTRDGLRPR